MPRRPAVTRERLAQLLDLPAAAIAHELGCTADHVNVLLRQHGLTCAPAGRGRRAGTRFTPGPEQRVVIQQFQASGLLVSGLASALGCTPAWLFDELSAGGCRCPRSGRLPWPNSSPCSASLPATALLSGCGAATSEWPRQEPVRSQKIANRNDKVTVQYMDGSIKRDVKYKSVEGDLAAQRCVLVEEA